MVGFLASPCIAVDRAERDTSFTAETIVFLAWLLAAASYVALASLASAAGTHANNVPRENT